VWGKYEDTHEQLRKILEPAAYELYGDSLQAIRNIGRSLDNQGMPPEEFANVFLKALTLENPKARYLVGPGTFPMWVIKKLPLFLRDRVARRYLENNLDSKDR
jgi:hypothetical protein